MTKYSGLIAWLRNFTGPGSVGVNEAADAIEALLLNKAGGELDMANVNRVEVIDPKGRAYVAWDDKLSVRLQMQDESRTLKVFIADSADEVAQVREVHDALPFAHFMEGRMVNIVERLRVPSVHRVAIMNEAANLLEKLQEQTDRIRELYNRRCEQTVSDFTEGEEMFLAELASILEREN